MSGKRGYRLWLAALGLVILSAAPAHAGPFDLLTRSTVDADPNKTYLLSEENGPWLILACTFSGETAEQDARELVLELRAKYKFRAYMFKKRFDLSGDPTGRGLDKYGAPLKMRYRRGDEIEEYAVMIGDFHDVDDRAAQDTLRKIKEDCKPECLRASTSEPSSRTLARWRSLVQLKPENQKKGPMAHAFLSTNPLLPDDFFSNPGVDEFVIKINEDSPYSLLNCRSKFTVQVARFTGSVLIDQAKIREIEEGGKLESKLDEAGVKAEQLAEALRMKGWEAYTFHDRYASIVTVGSFDSVGTPRGDGRTEINPQVHKIMETFRAKERDLPGRGNQLVCETLASLPFDVQPIPVQVPRKSISAAYNRPGLSMR